MHIRVVPWLPVPKAFPGNRGGKPRLDGGSGVRYSVNVRSPFGWHNGEMEKPIHWLNQQKG